MPKTAVIKPPAHCAPRSPVPQSGMVCQTCGADTKTIDSRAAAENSVRRRRECLNPDCRERFTTYERRDDVPPMQSIDQHMLMMVKMLKKMHAMINLALEDNDHGDDDAI